MVLEMDSTAAIGIGNRIGVGSLRHLECKTLWIQDLVQKKQLKIAKIPGRINTADLGTKPLAAAEMHTFLARCGISFKEGRHGLALRAAEA